MKRAFLLVVAVISSLFVTNLVLAQPVAPTNAAGNVLVSGSQVRSGNGTSCTAPGYSFTNGLDTGLSYSSGQLVVCSNNFSKHYFDTAGIFHSSAANAADGIIFDNEGEIQWPDSKIAEVGNVLSITSTYTQISGDFLWGSSGVCSLSGGAISCTGQSIHLALNSTLDDDTAGGSGTAIIGNEPDAVSTNSAVRICNSAAAPAANTVMSEVCYNCSRTAQGTQIWRVDKEGDVVQAGDLTIAGVTGGTITGGQSSGNAVLTLDGTTGSQLAYGSNFLRATASQVSSSFGTASTLAALGGVLFASSTAVGNVLTSQPDDLISYSMPANTLVATPRGIRITAMGTCANNANAKTFTMNFGSQVVLTHACTVNVASTWKISTVVLRTGASAQDWFSDYTGNSGAANAFEYDPEIGTATQTESGAIAIKMQSTVSTSTNDIVHEYLLVEAL